MKATAQSVIGTEKYTAEIKAGSHTITADVPKAQGGQDKGLTPEELLAASLAACTSITLKMYVDRKEWPVKKINVEITLENNPDLDSAIFERKITIEGESTEEQREKMLKIANSCPIHKTLTKSIFVNTSIK